MSPFLREVRIRFRNHALPVLASLVMFAGIQQTVTAIQYPLTGIILSGTNALILKGFRNTLPVANFYMGFPWSHHVKVALEGVIVLILGSFLGLWAHARSQRRLA